MSAGISILLTLAIIAVIVLAHEWGHFMSARRIGIPVYEFSFGFGYKLFSINKNGVMYSIRLIPMGGFVRMAGEEPGDTESVDGFLNRTPLEKIRVSVAGPFMNFVLALIIFIFCYAVIGIPQASKEAVLGSVVNGKPAAAAGLQGGDRILSVNGQEVASWEEFTTQMTSYPVGATLDFKVKRNDQILDIQVTSVANEGTGTPVIGVLNQVEYQRQGIVQSVVIGFKQTYELTRLMLGGLWTLVTGNASTADLAGPVGITKMVGEAAQVGNLFLLNFAAFLSINIGILNLLPLPALDGGRIIFALVEIIRRKPLEPEKEGFIHWLGFIFLMILIIVVTYNDIVKLIKG